MFAVDLSDLAWVDINQQLHDIARDRLKFQGIGATVLDELRRRYTNAAFQVRKRDLGEFAGRLYPGAKDPMKSMSRQIGLLVKQRLLRRLGNRQYSLC